MNESLAESPVTTARNWRHLFWLLLIAFILLAAGMGLRDPWPSDEPRFALAAKQMIESGDWLFPHRGNELYSDKPPMMMWLEAISYLLTGSWRVAFLLPSLLCGLLTLGFTWDLGRRLWNPRVGLYAAGAVLCVFQFVYQVKRAQIDPVVMGWITLANWGLLLHFLRGPNWRAYWFGCFMAGIGVITKGVGFLALLMFVPYLVARIYRWDQVASIPGDALRWLGGALAFFGAIALWLVPMVIVAKSRGTPEYVAYMNDILYRQTAERYANAWHHVQPFWYFLPIILFNWFPLSLAYPVAVMRWWEALKARDARLLLPLAWTVLILIFFSIPSGKRDVYVMPAIPMVALALSPYLEEFVRSYWLRMTAFVITLVGGLVILGAGLWTLVGDFEKAQRFITERELAMHATAVWLMVVTIGIVLLIAATLGGIRRGVHALLGGIAGLWLVWSLWAHPMLNDSSSAVGVMRRAGAIVGQDAEIGLVAWREQNLLMADRKVAVFGFRKPVETQFVEAVAWQAQNPAKRWIFINADVLNRCVVRDKAQFAGYSNRRGWYLLPSAAVVPDCTPEVAVATKPAAPADADGDGDGDGG